MFVVGTRVFFLSTTVKLNPQPHMPVKMENMEFMMNKDEGRKICKLFGKNTTSLETTCAKMAQ